MTDTVEWGTERERPSRIPRLALAAPRRHTLAIAGSLAILGFALTLTAELLPWLELKPNGAVPPRSEFSGEIDTSLQLTQLLVWQAPAYYVSITALLALTALALFGRPLARRGAAAAAVGAAAGQAVLLAALLGAIREGNELTGTRQLREAFEFGTGDGFYSAAAGLVLIAGAAALAGWWSDARPPKATAADPQAAHGQAVESSTGKPDAAGPGERPDELLDLTVAPASPFHERA